MRLEEVKNQLFKIEQTLYRDNNSPVLMIDQLWLWVVDESLLHVTWLYADTPCWLDSSQRPLLLAFHIGCSLRETMKILMGKTRQISWKPSPRTFIVHDGQRSKTQVTLPNWSSANVWAYFTEQMWFPNLISLKITRSDQTYGYSIPFQTLP